MTDTINQVGAGAPADRHAASLLRSAEALLKLDAAGKLAPHGIGGLARELIEGFVALTKAQAEQQPVDPYAGCERECGGVGAICRCRVDEAAERERLQREVAAPELWAVHAQGPDDLYPAFSREDAEQHAAALNSLSIPGIQVAAVVVPSPWAEAEHWRYLAEQEREHKQELSAAVKHALAEYRATLAGKGGE